MADTLDQIESREAAEQDALLQRADHDRTWAQTFSNTPPSEVLRANRNYEDLLANATERRMQIQSQYDPKAQQMYFNSRLQPLKEQLLQGQIEHQAASTIAAGAAERYKQSMDLASMDDQVNFLHHMENAPAPGTPEYQKHVLLGLDKYPHVLTTQFGKDLVTNLGQTNDTIAALKAQIPEDFKVKTITAGGGRQSHVTAERIEPSDKIPSAALHDLGQLNAEKASKTYWLNREKDPEKKAQLQAEIDDANTRIAAWHETYQPQPKAAPSATPSATPKRMKFNPQTGKLE